MAVVAVRPGYRNRAYSRRAATARAAGASAEATVTPASRAACPDRRRHYLRPARRSRHRELREVPAIDQAIRVSAGGTAP